uniref:Putative product n=1 Tax=Xenopsylla cheopis TaxID=163159 RepID=A0A6M2DMY9_XENCH
MRNGVASARIVIDISNCTGSPGCSPSKYSSCIKLSILDRLCTPTFSSMFMCCLTSLSASISKMRRSSFHLYSMFTVAPILTSNSLCRIISRPSKHIDFIVPLSTT